jgi:hypothetical protein
MRMPAAEDLTEGREQEAHKFNHPHRLVDPAARILPPHKASGNYLAMQGNV